MTDLLKSGANVVIDGQWGSTGKGKLAAYLADHSEIVYATADFQPNAGHTVVLDGKSYILHCIPGGFVNRDASLFLTAASSIIIDQFMSELEMLSDFGVADRIRIHPHAGVVTPEDAQEEAESLKGIASTMQGTGAALSRKIRRKAKLAMDFPELKMWVNDETREITRLATKRWAPVLVETAQGFDLSLNHGVSYPYVTSRDVTTASALSNVGIPPHAIGEVWGSLRANPIRVGNVVEDGVEVGHSGPCYPDQKELTWGDISQNSGKDTIERTTVTKRVRRIFTWSDLQFKRFLAICGPTKLFLNFANYLDGGLQGTGGARMFDDLPPSVRDFIARIEGMTYPELTPVSLLGTGPAHEDMIRVS